KISSEKNKQMIKDVVLNKSPSTFGYLKNTWSIRLLAKHLTKVLAAMHNQHVYDERRTAKNTS
ncbi:MAG: hypothetical protein WBX01_12940, partial [Nitrososphaeraceae archaeon]